ncbi:MAG: ABC transporter permease [Cyanobacteriota bacterium]|nr:ABC transporter permease [Cyanobacteriota bacterium]
MIELLKAELKRTWIQSTRYPLEALGRIFITTCFFYALFLGSKYIAEPPASFGNRLDSIVIGYILWTLVIFIVNDIAITLQIEVQTGTLQQVLLSPYEPVKIFLARALASLLLRLTTIITILLIILVLTGSQLAFPISLLLPLLSVILGAYGLAFMMGSLAVLLKRIQQLLVILQFGLLFLLATPIEDWQGIPALLGLWLPMTAGAGLLRQVMAQGMALDGFRAGLALLVGLLYFIVGLACFRWAVNHGKQQGNLGTY